MRREEEEKEKEVARLFSQAKNKEQRKMLFFVLPNREKATLEGMVKENVEAGSMVLDEFKRHNGLTALGFEHRTTWHKRCSRMEFGDGTALRITTNHIERMWVELRKTHKHMPMEKVVPNILLESFRQYSLFHKSPRKTLRRF